MTEKTKGTIAVIHNIQSVREGIVRAFSNSSELSVCSDSSTVKPVLAAKSEQCPNLILLDVTQNGSDEEINRVKKHCPSVAIVVWGVSLVDEEIIKYAKLGAAGYVTCEDSMDDLVDAAEYAIRGEVANKRIAGVLNRYVYGHCQDTSNPSDTTPSTPTGSSNGSPNAKDSKYLLTPREIQIVSMINDGMCNKEIARKLGLELSTVKNHVHSILTKYNVKRRSHAAAQFRSESTSQRVVN